MHRPMKLDASIQTVSMHPYGPATPVTWHQAPAAALTTLTMSTSALQPAARLSSTSMQGARRSEGPIAVADTCPGLSLLPPAPPCTPLAASKRKSAPPTLADGGAPSPLQDYQYREAGVGASGDALIGGERDDTQQSGGGWEALEPVIRQDGQSALRPSAVTHHGAIAAIQAHTTADSAAARWDRLWQRSAKAVLGSWEGDLTSDKGTEQSSEPSDRICEFWEEESLLETASAEPVGATWERSEPSGTEEKAKDKNTWSQSAMHLDQEPQRGEWLGDWEPQTTAKDQKLPEGQSKACTPPRDEAFPGDQEQNWKAASPDSRPGVDRCEAGNMGLVQGTGSSKVGPKFTVGADLLAREQDPAAAPVSTAILMGTDGAQASIVPRSLNSMSCMDAMCTRYSSSHAAQQCPKSEARDVAQLLGPSATGAEQQSMPVSQLQVPGLACIPDSQPSHSSHALAQKTLERGERLARNR